ncbi:MAG: hypothetical protein KatS3mg114_0275 [Planctomycetaceae bacterium]|nr:MAG: hypothetical protein KatS3mg114_0275 [Planctomycetaceae bacterium]
MICISVTPESRQLAKVDIYNASRQCDLVEVCLDRLHKEPDFKDLLEGCTKPVLISCRRPEEGGHFKGSEEDRLQLLRLAILANPAYVEMDVETARKIPRFGKVQRVVSFINLNGPLGDIEQMFDEAVAVKADVIKCTWPTQTLEAAWPLLAVVSQKRSLPVVGLGLGRCGLTFSLLGRKYGSPWIYAALEKGMEAFPGQPTVGELDEIYRWRHVDHKTRFIGMLGFNETTTALARVLNAGFDCLQLNTRCLPFEFQSTQQLAKMLEILKVPAVIATPGAVRRLMPLAQQADDVAQQAQASDLLVRQPSGWFAYNILWKVALKALEDKLGRKTAEDRPLDRRNVMILGSDGLAASMAAGVKRRKGLVSLCSGDEASAQKLAASLELRFIPLAKLYDTLADVVILTVSNLDYHGKKTPINPALLRHGMGYLDVTEPPAESALTSEARGRGCRVVEPAEFFVDYARALFKSLVGQDLPEQAFAQGFAP